MKIRKLRVRSLNIRVTEDEYLALERYSEVSSARSLSDFVRMVLQGFAGGQDQADGAPLSLAAYAAQMKNLEKRVEGLTAELEILSARSAQRMVVTDGAVEPLANDTRAHDLCPDFRDSLSTEAEPIAHQTTPVSKPGRTKA